MWRVIVGSPLQLVGACPIKVRDSSIRRLWNGGNGREREARSDYWPLVMNVMFWNGSSSLLSQWRVHPRFNRLAACQPPLSFHLVYIHTVCVLFATYSTTRLSLSFYYRINSLLSISVVQHLICVSKRLFTAMLLPYDWFRVYRPPLHGNVVEGKCIAIFRFIRSPISLVEDTNGYFSQNSCYHFFWEN